jgi:alkanesulfonate monooxygenase SsuD/methylene tetrahydromethanopterin reductase-like flavin-dependent oxidoreductase (luciferase family)
MSKRRLKRQAKAFDRHPDQIKILPGISPFIASTQVEADRRSFATTRSDVLTAISDIVHPCVAYRAGARTIVSYGRRAARRFGFGQYG